MSDSILIISIGIIAIFIILAIKLIAYDIRQMHKDIRRIVEYSFWSYKREVETRKLLRHKNKSA